jgi:hypothetical protein
MQAHVRNLQYISQVVDQNWTLENIDNLGNGAGTTLFLL